MSTREFNYRPNGNPQFLQDHLNKIGTAVATEEQVGPSIKIPGGMLGKNGSLEVVLKALVTNDAVVKNLRVRAGNTADVLSGSVLLNAVLTSLGGGSVRLTLANRDNQLVNIATAEGTGVVALPVVTALDTSKDLFLVFSTQKASGAAGSVALESYRVELFAEPVANTFQ
jgi:hypothetical protein